MKHDRDTINRGIAVLACVPAVGFGLIASSLAGGWAMFLGTTIVGWFVSAFVFAWLTSFAE